MLSFFGNLATLADCFTEKVLYKYFKLAKKRQKVKIKENIKPVNRFFYKIVIPTLDYP